MLENATAKRPCVEPQLQNDAQSPLRLAVQNMGSNQSCLPGTNGICIVDQIPESPEKVLLGIKRQITVYVGLHVHIFVKPGGVSAVGTLQRK